MTISIIIASYRQPHFLGRAIESCLAQDHEDLEVIVVDDHSRDSSLGLAVSFALRDGRVRVVEAAENGGLGRARNIGLAHAQGDFVCFLDADDYLLPGSLSSRLDAFPEAQETHGESLVAVYGDWQHVGEFMDHPVVREARQDMAVVSRDNYTGENVFICSAPLVRRTAVVEAGGFPEGLAMLEDFALWAKMIAAGGVFAPVSEVVATYRQRPNSMLRGDGVVVMADYVEKINDWMGANGVPLADGGAFDAWLDGRPPYPFGRMGWDVPSPPGYFSEETDRSVVLEEALPRSSDAVPDFMHQPVAEGLANPDPIFSVEVTDQAEVVLVVDSLRSSIDACGFVQSLDGSATSVAVYCENPADWPSLWPLALAGLAPQPSYAIPSNSEPLDLSETGAARTGDLVVVPSVVTSLCPPKVGATAGVVYISKDLQGYAAIDAWISVAARAMESNGLDVVLLVDPSVEAEVRGWRFEFLALDTIGAAPVIIAPPGSSGQFVSELAPTIFFSPGSADTNAVRTAGELRSAIERQLG